MKRWLPLILCCLLLAGCAAQTPPEDGRTHFEDFLVVETPEGFVLQENKDALAPNGLYYASWSQGEAQKITNEAGEEANCYDAEIYLLLQQCGDPEEAQDAVETWVALEQENYETGEVTQAGGYTRLSLEKPKADNPYAQGAAAFAAREDWAVSVEVLCGPEQDPQALLEAFLGGFHYGED